MSKESNKMTTTTGGVFDSVKRLGEAIKTLGKEYNLLVPGGALGDNLPLLYAAGVSFVFVDPNHETYPIQGKSDLGIGKNALDRIAGAAGIQWNPHLCGRVNNDPSPFIVEYQVAGTVLQLDGTERMLTGTKRVDLRAEQGAPESTWGADAQEFARLAKKDGREPWPQIMQARQHILSLAETKAKNRAIRTLGLRTAYKPAELEKGFAVLRLQFTGRSEDPEVERAVSLMIAQRALSSASMLYGVGNPDHALPPMRERVVNVVPRVVRSEPEDDSDDAPDPGAKADEPAGAAPAAAPAPACPKEDPEIICGGQLEDGSWPKKPCSKFTATELKSKIAAYEKKRPEWDPKWAKKNEDQLNAMKAWLAYREISAPASANKTDEVPY